MKLAAFFNRTSELIDSFIKKIVFLLIVTMTIAITMQIIFRVFFDSLTWTEELSRYLLVWSTFLAATLAYKRGMHISVTFVVNLFPKAIRKILVILSIIISMVFFIVLIIIGIKYIGMTTSQVSAALRIPMKWVYIVLPISFIVLTIHGIDAAFEVLLDSGEV